MRLCLAGMALLTIAAASPSANSARPASPQNQERWLAKIQETFAGTNIPAPTGAQVRVQVSIGMNGQVTACTIVNTSGARALDEAVCNGMKRYARYNPAIGADGQPREILARTTIIYVNSK